MVKLFINDVKINIMNLVLIFVSFFACLLSGCTDSERHSKIVSFTPASVVIDYTATGDLIEATDQAQRYCGSMKKDAQFVRTDAQGGYFASAKKVAFFNCVDSSNNTNANNQQQIVIPFNNNNNNNNNNANNR